VAYLDNCFKNKGKTYTVENKGDRWHLYTLSLSELNERPDLLKVKPEEPDQTIEILMTNLDTKTMNSFFKGVYQSGEEVTKGVGIDLLIPEMEIHDYLFEPCGYSMNGIMEDGSYMTIHVTPEPGFSFVSFEANVPYASYNKLIERVVQTFQPGNFIVTIFANEKSASTKAAQDLKSLSQVAEWTQSSNDQCRFHDYDMSVAFYRKFPS